MFLEIDKKLYLLIKCISSTVCRGPFLEQFLKDNPDLRHKEVPLRLAFIALFALLSVAPVESGHASIRRLLLKLGVHTHQVDLELASSLWMGLQEQANVADNDLKHFVDTLPEFLAKHSSSADSKASAASASSGEEKTSGHGGAWRAMISTGYEYGEKRNFKQCSERYASMTAEEKKTFVEEGIRGTQRANNGEKAFRPTKREVDRAERRDTIQARCNQLASRYAPEFADGPTGFLVAHAEDIVRASSTPQAAISAARQDSRLLGKMRSGFDKKMRQELHSYTQTQGVIHKDRLFGHIEHMREQGHRFSLRPCALPCAPSLFCVQSMAAVRATCVASLVNTGFRKNQQGRGLGPAIAATSHKLHSIIRHHECEQVPNKTAAQVRAQRCLRARHCICSASGKVCYKIRNAILAMLKAA